jgi:hypothetical protein
MERDLKNVDFIGLSFALKETIAETPLNGKITIKVSTTDHDNLEKWKGDMLLAMESLIIAVGRPDIKVEIIEVGNNDLN